MIKSQVMARVENLQGSVLQLGDYSNLPDIKKAKTFPFHVIKRRIGDQLLGFYGMHHHDDLTHPDHDNLRTEFSQFERRTRGTKRIIITEGSIAEAGEDEASSFKDGRPQGSLLAYWAMKYDIPIISGEPEPLWSEAEVVEKRFSKHDDPDYGKKLIFYYYSGRVLTQLARMPEKDRTRAEEYLRKWFQEYRDSWGWPEFDFSFNNLGMIHEELYEMPFDPTDDNFFLDQAVNYRRSETPIQQVAQMVNKIRDSVLAYTHLELLDPGSTESYLQNADEVGKYCIQQAKQKKGAVEHSYGSGKYSIFDSHGYFHSIILAPELEKWGVKDSKTEF